MDIYQHKFNSNSQMFTLFSGEMGFVRYFFSAGSRQEVNRLDIPRLRNQSNRAKSTIHLSLYTKVACCLTPWQTNKVGKGGLRPGTRLFRRCLRCFQQERGRSDVGVR